MKCSNKHTATKKVSESAIDFPRKGLCPLLWDKNNRLRPEAKQKILDVLRRIPTGGRPVECSFIHLVGSMGTNQYTDESDIDIHIQPKEKKYRTEAEQKRVKNWVEENRDRIDAYIGSHPIEVYIQLDRRQDLMADACYDIIRDRWIKGPHIVPLDYNPYEDYSDLMDDIRAAASEIDVQLGELKRDVIDFNTILNAIRHLPAEQKRKLKRALEAKRDEIERSVEELYKLRKIYVDARKKASSPPYDKSMEKRWRDANAVQKFMQRYKYTKLIGKLAEMLEDDDRLSDKEIKSMEAML